MNILTKTRIECMARSAHEAVELLNDYEAALIREEMRRQMPTSPLPGDDFEEAREFLGREVTEEVIEFVNSEDGYKARRVVRYPRIDLRLGQGDRTAAAAKAFVASLTNDRPIIKDSHIS